MSPLTQGLNYRSACDIGTYRFSVIDHPVQANLTCQLHRPTGSSLLKSGDTDLNTKLSLPLWSSRFFCTETWATRQTDENRLQACMYVARESTTAFCADH